MPKIWRSMGGRKRAKTLTSVFSGETRSTVFLRRCSRSLLFAGSDLGFLSEKRAGVLLDEVVDIKMQLAQALLTDSDDDPTLTYTKADIHRRLVQILGKDEWKRVQTLFPLLHEYWEE